MDFVTIEQQIFFNSFTENDKVALIGNKKKYTYKQLFQNVLACKHILESEYNIKEGDVILLAADKNMNFIFSYFAIHLIGAIVAPIDLQIKAERLNLITEKVKPKLILGLIIEKTDVICENFEIFQNIELQELPENLDFPKKDETADIMFTTGTTGEAKGVLLTHGNIAASAKNINTFIKNDSSDMELLTLPISHSFGLGRIRCVLTIGGTLVLLGSIVNIKRMFRMFDDHNITGFCMVPASWAYIRTNSGNRLGEYSEKLNYIEFGSAFLSVEDKEELIKLFPNTRICMHYGLTEASRSAFMEFHSDIRFLSTVGKPSPNVDIRIMNENGSNVAIGEEGEICVKGDHVCQGYLQISKNDVFYNEFFRTGDAGFIDVNGYVTLKGRVKEIINVGGKKLSPIEVEDIIKKFDPKLEVVCVGVPDKNLILGEVVKAFVVKGSSISTFDDISEYLKSKLERYKLPVEYEWIDKIPKTSSGKIQRHKLK